MDDIYVSDEADEGPLKVCFFFYILFYLKGLLSGANPDKIWNQFRFPSQIS